MSTGEIDNLVQEVEEMALSKPNATITGGKLLLPSVQYIWTDRFKQQRVTLDYLLPAGTTTNQVKVEVSDCGRWLSLMYKPPQSLYDERRLLLANRLRGDTTTLNSTSHKVVALASAIGEIKKQFVEEEVILTHREKLPIKCDLNLCTEELPTGCEMYAMSNEDDTMGQEYGQHYLIYSVDLVSVEKPKKKVVAAMNLAAFGSPSDLGDNPDATIAQEKRAAMELEFHQRVERELEKQKQQLLEQLEQKERTLAQNNPAQQQKPKGGNPNIRSKSGRKSTPNDATTISAYDSVSMGDYGGTPENDSAIPPVTPTTRGG